jgi:putative phosphoesterase
MLVGLISDTHGKLRPEIFNHFENVDLILHAGDIGPLSLLLAELEAIAEVRAVVGNTDGFDLLNLIPEVQELTLEHRRTVLTHGHLLGSPTPALLRRAHPAAQIIVYGHTHRPLLDRSNGVLVVNPGSAGAARFNLKPSIALLDLPADGEPQVSFIELG